MKKKNIYTLREVKNEKLESTKHSFLLASLVLHDFFDFDDEQILRFYEKVNHYADLLGDKRTGITVKYVTKLLADAGVELHYVD